jgi:heme/copper-type cytochrome/quinol oxidase subunit 2
MKKTLLILVVAVLVLVSIIFWVFNIQKPLNPIEILMILVPLILIGFALYLGFRNLGSTLRKEPVEDELSKKVVTKASSLSFYISLYMWLFVMYISDKTTMEPHSLIGAGIAGMALIFLLSWIGVKVFGLTNE